MKRKLKGSSAMDYKVHVGMFLNGSSEIVVQLGRERHGGV